MPTASQFRAPIALNRELSDWMSKMFKHRTALNHHRLYVQKETEFTIPRTDCGLQNVFQFFTGKMQNLPFKKRFAQPIKKGRKSRFI
jgi:hypothetical protein